MVIRNKEAYFLLFLCCIVSRIATTIYYIEDTDSLRFALSIGDYDITKLQPHFPGYPIYCFIAKILFFFTKSMAVSFSIIGAVSIFSIIYFLLKIYKVDLWTINGVIFSSLVFFNPLLWLMSNRYMPDLMGLAFAVSAFYFLSDKKNILFGFLITGLLAGVRLSYLPILIVPICYRIYLSKRKLSLLFAGLVGFLIWLIPLIWITSFENLFSAAFKQTHGHFLDFGGTIITEDNWIKRLSIFIRSIWSDGLGGYWFGRSLQTIFLSIPMLYIMFFGLREIKISRWNKNYLIMICFLFVYGFWVFFFQNVIYKSRHILPLLVPLLITLFQGGAILIKKENFLNKIIIGLFFISMINITSVLVLQHKNPSAISRIKDQLIAKDDGSIIVSTPLINYYLKYNGVVGDFLNIESENDIKKIISQEIDGFYLIGDFKDSFISHYQIVNDSVYFHNPYVNRMWASINMSTLEKK